MAYEINATENIKSMMEKSMKQMDKLDREIMRRIQKSMEQLWLSKQKWTR
jgi:hypothetical protein